MNRHPGSRDRSPVRAGRVRLCRGVTAMAFRRAAFIVAVAGAIAGASATTALALGDGPAIASDWADLTAPREKCFARGEAAIRRMDFGEIERTKYSRFASREDYTISVRCEPEKSIVLFLAAGRDRKRANALQLNLQRNYLMEK